MTNIIKQGSVAPLSEKLQPKTDRLNAMVFTAGNGRAVVRLVPEKLDAAEKQSLALLGLTHGKTEPVGISAQRAVGFPAWPIINDPDNAQHALNLVGDLEWARRNAHISPKKVKERFDALVIKLTASAPHFVPTLLEELARIFHNADNTKLAKQYFNKAREVERAYALEIDPDRHSAVFTEFGIAGIVGPRELTAETASAMERCEDPTAAFEYLLEVNIDRIRAGMEPYALMARDLRKAGKAAGLSAQDVDDQIFDRTLELKAFLDAPSGFFTAIEASLVRYARQRPEAQKVLLRGRPGELDTDQYLELLDNAGALEGLRRDRPRLAAWLVHMIQDKELIRCVKQPDDPLRKALFGDGDEYVHQEHKRLIAEVSIAGDALRGQEMKLVPGMSLNLVDALCEGGISWSDTDDVGLTWNRWLLPEYEECRRDLRFAAEDPVISQLLVECLFSWQVGGCVDTLLAHDGARDLLLKKMKSLVLDCAGKLGNLAEVDGFIKRIGYYADPQVSEAAPKLLKKLLTLDTAKHFQQTVRRGTFAELQWPALDAAVQRLTENTEDFQVLETFPAAAIVAKDRLEVVDGNRVVLQAEIPADCRAVDRVRLVGDQEAAVVYDKPGRWLPSVYWTGSALSKDFDHVYQIEYGYSLPVKDGRLTGKGLLVENSLDWVPTVGNVWSTQVDGIPAFITPYTARTIEKWNGDSTEEWSGSGKDVIQELRLDTDFGLDFSQITEECRFDPYSTMIVPVQETTVDSPLGHVNGVHIGLSFEKWPSERWEGFDNIERKLVSPLGSFTTTRDVIAVVRRPGGGVWLASRNALWDAERDLKIDSCLPKNTPVTEENLPIQCWHQLVPSDEQASKVMREYSLDQAAEVVAGANIDAGLIARQLGTSNKRLIDAVVAIAQRVKSQEEELRQLYEQALTPEEETEEILTDGGANLLYEYRHWNNLGGGEAMCNALSFLKEFRDNPNAEMITKADLMRAEWLQFANNERELVALLGAPIYRDLLDDDQSLTTLIAFLRQATSDGVFGSGGRSYTINVGEFNRRDEAADILPVGTVVDGCVVLHADFDRTRASSKDTIVEVRTVWAPGERSTIGGYAVDKREYFPLSADQFLECLDAIEHADPKRRIGAERRASLAEATELSPEAITYLYGGLKHLHSWKKYDQNKEIRDASGFSIVQAKSARVQCRVFSDLIPTLLAAAVPADNPVEYVTNGPDVRGVAQLWRKHMGVPQVHLSSEELWELCLGSEFVLRTAVTTIVADKEHVDSDEWFHINGSATALRMILQIVGMRPLNDPIRPFLAEKLEWLKEKAAEAYRKPEYADQLCDVELGGDYNDSRFDYETTPETQSIRLLLEGHVDSLIEDLKTVHDLEGNHWNPEVSAPEVVKAVCEEFGISKDAAVYFLQLLALAYPTDANIRSWNGWKTKDIDRAAAELVGKKLIVEAKRTGAGRSRFLPGGWLLASKGNGPMETWKAPHYLLWRSTKVQPVLEACPVFVPAKQLFEDVWRRYLSGDKPGYEELRTTRYRRRTP